MATDKKKPPYLLFVLLPLLAIGIVAFLRDRGARQAAVDANDKIDAVSRETERKSPDDVKLILGRDPDGPISKSNGRLVEKYTWRGALQSYYVCVVYNEGDPPVLNGVYLNEEP
ncbi:MAG: hypothetical protein KDA42_09130 [Planctomycetales bacterium]|nr:hypothetical protein [Planctomycetales bacterium]